jgi:hypothetical protein
MGDYADDVRRSQQVRPYPKAIDGIYRQNVRRVVATAQDNAFQVTPDDAILLVNTGENDQNASVNLPLLTQCAPDQRFIIMNVDPGGASGTQLTINVFTGSNDPVNEISPAPAIVILQPNEVREFVRGFFTDIDSWYTMCCTTELQA